MHQPWFPDLRGDDSSPDAYLGGSLTLPWVLAAYRRGFFPWPAEGEPLAWWCPRLRMVFEHGGVYVSKRLARTLRQGRFRVTLDQDFDRVLARCRDQRGPGRWGTWITPAITQVYGELHRKGVGHSVEVWREGRLAGGLYGLALGGAFFGESMFSDERDASKVALVALSRQLEAWGFDLFDCQVPNDHLVSMGGRSLPRSVFLERLQRALARPGRTGSWALDPGLLEATAGGGGRA